MIIFEILCLVLIACCVVLCLRKGHKRLAFRICSAVLVMLMAQYLGTHIGDLMLPDLIKDPRGVLGDELLDKINDSLASILGTIILFLTFLIILKQMFRIIEGRMNKNIQKIIAHRVLGTLNGIYTFRIDNRIVIILRKWIGQRSINKIRYLDKDAYRSDSGLIILKYERILN